jgi:hypothetical protein
LAEPAQPLSDKELRDAIISLVKKESAAWLDLARVLMPILGSIGVLIGVSLSGAAGRAEFYRTATTVIPTLLLTLAVQGRFFRLSALGRSPLYQELKRKRITRDHVKGFGLPGWASWVFLYATRRMLTPVASTMRYSVTLLLVIAAGEAAAVYVAAVGRPTSFYLGVVTAAMTAAFLAIATIALFGAVPESEADETGAARFEWRHVLDELIRRKATESAVPGAGES